MSEEYTQQNVERLLDNLDWQKLPEPVNPTKSFPFATHEAILDIGGLKMKVVQLNTGQRVIDSDDLNKFFDSGDD